MQLPQQNGRASFSPGNTMKFALITTTINVPRVLQHYHSMDVKIFVAIDKNTSHDAINFCQYDTLNCEVLFIEQQQKWKSSEFIGWNTDSRRNIALLEAIKWGANIVASIDDDMIPADRNFCPRIEHMLVDYYSGLQLGAPEMWFDAGQYTVPPARQRGLPTGHDDSKSYDFVTDVKIGAMQGIILGVPDTDAATTISNNPFVTSATDVLKNGFVVNPASHAVFNSQITAFRREFAPAFAQFYKWQGRNTDLFASLIMRRVMREHGCYTYFGPPMGFHARSPRDPFKDMKAEMWGLEHIRAFADWLNEMALTSANPSAMTREIYTEALHQLSWWPGEVTQAALAFCDDMEGVM